MPKLFLIVESVIVLWGALFLWIGYHNQQDAKAREAAKAQRGRAGKPNHRENKDKGDVDMTPPILKQSKSTAG